MRGYVIFLAMYRGTVVGFRFLRAVSAHPFCVCVSDGLVCPTRQCGAYLYQWFASVYASPKTKAMIPPVIAQYAPGSTGRSKISLIKIKIKFATTIRNLRDFSLVSQSLCILSPPLTVGQLLISDLPRIHLLRTVQSRSLLANIPGT